MNQSLLQELLRPLVSRVTNMVSRIVVGRVDDSKKLQVIQIGGLADADDAEHHQPYGFSSVPLNGAEGVAVFPNGDAGIPLVVVVSDRRHRPKDGEPGEVTVYNHTGAKMKFTKDGDIELTPAPGREVFIRDDGGTVDRLVKKSEHDGHTHGPGTFTTPSAGGGGGPVTGVSGGAAAVTGTEKLRVQ